MHLIHAHECYACSADWHWLCEGESYCDCVCLEEQTDRPVGRLVP